MKTMPLQKKRKMMPTLKDVEKEGRNFRSQDLKYRQAMASTEAELFCRYHKLHP
jgi:hypothetical protein